MDFTPIKGIAVAVLSVAAVAYKPIMKSINSVPPSVTRQAPEIGDVLNQSRRSVEILQDINGFDNLVNAGKLQVKKISETDREVKYLLEVQIDKQIKEAHCLFKRNEQADRLLRNIEQSNNFIAELIAKNPQHEEKIEEWIKKACALQ